MKEFLYGTAIVATLIAFVPAYASPWTDYYLKISKMKQQSLDEPGVTLYEIGVETMNNEPITPSGKFATALEEIYAVFAVPKVEADSCDYSLAVESRSNQKLAMRFTFKAQPEQAFLSCFQNWYLKLSSSERLKLSADMHNPSAVINMAAHANSFKTSLNNNFAQCATLYDGIVMEGTGDMYYAIGLHRWFNGLTLEADYSNFKLLFDPSHDLFMQKYQAAEQAPSCSSALLKKWLSDVSSRSTQASVIASLAEVLSNPANTSPSFFAFNCLSLWSTEEELDNFKRNGKTTDNLVAALNLTDDLIFACFDQGEIYSCDNEKKAAERLVHLILNSKLADKPISFIVPKN